MREIKFRAWFKFHKKMVYNLGFNEDSFRPRDDVVDIPCVWDKDRPYDNDNATFNFDIMQYTGLHDKNGVEIYENNILNNKYLVIKLLTKYVLFDILKRDILKEGLKINETEITGEYQEIPENEKRDIDKYLQQAEREIIEKGVAFA